MPWVEKGGKYVWENTSKQLPRQDHCKHCGSKMPDDRQKRIYCSVKCRNRSNNKNGSLGNRAEKMKGLN